LHFFVELIAGGEADMLRVGLAHLADDARLAHLQRICKEEHSLERLLEQSGFSVTGGKPAR
jgi:hypothetical protein